MSTPDEKVAKIASAYRCYTGSKGKDCDAWFRVISDDLVIRSIGEGRPGMAFSAERHGKKEFEEYLAEVQAEWQMESFEVRSVIAQGDWVVSLADTAWVNLKTGKRVESPKADFFRFEGEHVVEIVEFYDTQKVAEAGTACGGAPSSSFLRRGDGAG